MTIARHFFDSGAYTLKKKATKRYRADWRTYFDTSDFWLYMGRYVRFVRHYHSAIDHYANVDAIGDAELTWRNQQWLEARGLCPVPVVHFNEDYRLDWLRHYVNGGYRHIALGGLTGSQTSHTKEWLDKCFDFVRGKEVRVHGFGVTGWEMLRVYPFASVDSTTWLKRSAFGEILVPRFHNQHSDFRLPWQILKVTQAYKKEYWQWLKTIHVNPALLCTSNDERNKANVRFFCKFQSAYPNTRIYLSGGHAEDYTRNKVSVMMTFYSSHNTPEPRLLKLFEQRSAVSQQKHTTKSVKAKRLSA